MWWLLLLLLGVPFRSVFHLVDRCTQQQQQQDTATGAHQFMLNKTSKYAISL